MRQVTPHDFIEHNAPLTDAAAAKARTRQILRYLAWIAIPFFLCQALAFVSFIYEESLQAAGFGCRAALMAEDTTLAREAVKNFEYVMQQAQWFQDHIGYLAFWSHGAYRTYFWKSAPTQLCGFYAEGKARQLWADDVRRWRLIKDGPNALPHFVDTWKASPTDRMLLDGFDPALISTQQ